MKHINASNAPEALGPYSHATKVSRPTFFVSGQIAIIPETNKLDNSSRGVETHRIMRNIGIILRAGGCDFDNICYVTALVDDREYFAEVNEAYASYFKEGKEPARMLTVGQTPVDGAHVEISVFAEVPQAPMLGEFCE